MSNLIRKLVPHLFLLLAQVFAIGLDAAWSAAATSVKSAKTVRSASENLSVAKPPVTKSTNDTDRGFLFQDEVTKEIVIDVHRDRLGALNPFDDLLGKFKPGSSEYQALLVAAGIAVDTGISADENIEVKSLKALRRKFDAEYSLLAATSTATAESENSPEPTIVAAKASSQTLEFSDVSESGFTDPKLGSFRLIPLERGLMLAGESGDKRVFSNRDVLKDDVFQVAIGKTESGERVLAILHQGQQDQNGDNGKFTVWILALTGKEAESSRVSWTKKLEFEAQVSSERSVASSSKSQITLDGETVSIAIGDQTKTLTLKTGESSGAQVGP